jgi:hypothetical protein
MKGLIVRHETSMGKHWKIQALGTGIGIQELRK